MSLVLRRTYLKAKNNVFFAGQGNRQIVFTSPRRTFSDDKAEKDLEYISSTILVENNSYVQELPVIVRRIKDLSSVCEDRPPPTDKTNNNSHDTHNYRLIQAEFNECLALRDVFTLLSKCTKITPDIALGAMERIYHLEKNPSPIPFNVNNVSVAKDAIVDKLLKVLMRTEETQTILNALEAVSSFIEPYKYQFCDEILLRAIDNKLSVEQLCSFLNFLVNNKSDPKYSEVIDKLWVGFIEKEHEINENNILGIFSLLPNLRDSKRIVFNLLEQKLGDLWKKINNQVMQEILSTFIHEKHWCPESFSVIGRWLYTNIHALDEDSLLEIITKFSKLQYSDIQIEKALEKYIKLKRNKIESPILVVGMLNFCIQFKFKNDNVLNGCCDYFLRKGASVPYSFIKYIVHPYGFLYFEPEKGAAFWPMVENTVMENLHKIVVDDIISIILSFIYIGHHPLTLVNKVFSADVLAKCANNKILMNKLHLIDTAMSLECKEYSGPLLPKDQWSTAISQDGRIKNLLHKIQPSLIKVVGDAKMLSGSVIVPHLCSDDTYLIDIMLHPVGLGGDTFNWMLKATKNENTAILIHLPEHYCSDDKQLVGPQEMRRRHLKILGMKVVSMKYTTLCRYQTRKNELELEQYLVNCIKNAETVT